MARTFDGTPSQGINFGTSPSIAMAVGSAWTVAAIMRSTVMQGDERSIFTRWADVGWQFRVRIVNESPPAHVAVLQTDFDGWTTTNTIATGVWYCLAFTNDGGGGAAVQNFYAYDIAAATFAIAQTADTSRTSDRAGFEGAGIETQIGYADASDPWSGQISHTAYFDFAMTQNNIRYYSVHPHEVSAHNVVRSQFYCPILGETDPEPDWSGNGKTGSINVGNVGASTIGPPTGIWMPMDDGLFTLRATPTSSDRGRGKGIGLSVGVGL